MERFTGTIEPFATVNVSEVVAWIEAIPFEAWPQQHRLEDGGIRPAMVTDLFWYSFGKKTWRILHQLGLLPDAYQLMLSVVMPGHKIAPHTDSQPDNWLYRVHVPLTSNPKAVTIMEDGEHNMKVGKAYKVNTTKTHAIENNGKTPRIHFMFDVRR